MKSRQTTEEIIEEYRQAKKQIRKIITEYEQTERRLFDIMVKKINAAEQNNNPHSNHIGSE